MEGRKVFANILKYVRGGASSNFGKMFRVLGASTIDGGQFTEVLL